MCNNQIYFCSQDKQDIRSLGHLNSEKSDTAGGIYTIVPELTSAVREAYVYTRWTGEFNHEHRLRQREGKGIHCGLFTNI